MSEETEQLDLQNPSVSCGFFCKCVQELTRMHGNRETDHNVEALRLHLALAEQAYKRMPPFQKIGKPARKKS